MRQDCIIATEMASGRTLNQAEIRGIEGRVRQAMRRMAADDPNGWRSLTRDERLIEAGERAAAELVHEAAKKAQRTALQVTKTAQLLGFVHAAATPMEAFDRLGDRIAFNSASRHGVTSVEKEAVAEGRRMIGKLVSDPDFIELMKTPEGIDATTRELHGESSGNAAAKRLAKVFHDEAETARCYVRRSPGSNGALHPEHGQSERKRSA
ncbi:MAG TPA: hypothetical protein PL117_02820 [Accumulibacter sp.]|uniref:hypothetical protein n=1 Tax=Accumulibacter sp. TaxID=2053492 RepID=UPI002B961C9A|nr:hypothetical protein [Accumulibacter sp.]HRF71678.1 hypothetical protein [Accumulibacter sp.]